MNRCLTAASALVLAALTACGPQTPDDDRTGSHTPKAPTAPAATGDPTGDETDGDVVTPPRRTTAPTSAPSSSTPSTTVPTDTDVAPKPHPIRSDTVRFLELIPSVQAAQNSQGTFAFVVENDDAPGRFEGQARCAEPVAWKASSPEGEEIHVDGKDYERDAGTDDPFRVSEDDDLHVDGDTPCNPRTLVDDSEQDSLTLQVSSRTATADGRSELTHLRGTADGTTYEFWLEPSRRPAQISMTENGRTQSIVYRDYGEPVSISAPSNVAADAPDADG